jgi:membrane protease YdiL (CAAX protease family)
VGPFLVVAYLLRYVPIRVQTGILIDRGVSRSTALSRARYLILEDPVCSSIVGAIQGLIWYPLVCLVVRVVEGGPCSLEDLGLAPRRRSLLLVPLGVVLALILYAGTFWVGRFFNETAFSWSPARLNTITVALVSLNFLTNGFGEETAFRAYFQDRLIQRHGLWVGIALASGSFVLLHLLIYRYSGRFLIASILLAAVYGILYVWTGSVYLVGTMHAVFNLAPRLLDQRPPGIGLLVVHGLGLLAVILIFGWRAERKGRLP